MSDTAPHPPVERVRPPAPVTAVGNPVLTWLLSGRRRSVRVGRSLLLLHVTGRRSRRVHTVPVAYHQQPDGRLLVLTSSGWRLNLRGGPTPVEVTLLGRRRPATAVLEEDPTAVAQVYHRLLGELGPRAGGRIGIRVNLDRTPTLDELADTVRREHLSVIRLDLSGPTG